MSLAPIGAIVALGVPALLVAVVPRRWSPAAMIAWLVSPAIVFLVLELIGKAIGTPTQAQPGNPRDALLLVGSFFLIPWILTCLTGFGIGFAIRRRRRPPEPAIQTVQAPTPTAAAPVPITRPVQPVMEGVSADGSLRYEHRQGEFINGRYDSASLSAVLTDAATGQLFVDCAGWASSEITAQADGSLFLRLQQNQFESMFRIDGRSGQFRNLGTGGGDEPLASLAQAVREAWLATAPHASPPHYRRISPDGAIRVDLASEEWSNSHWVNAPRVIELASGRTLLDLWGTDWDATVSFREVGRVQLDCRRYHAGGGLSVVLDVARGCYQIALHPSFGGTLPEQPIDGVAEGLEAASRRVTRSLGAQGRGLPVSPHPLTAWRAALLILLGALILIAGASFLSVHLGSPPGRATLSHVPPLISGAQVRPPILHQ